LTFDLLTLVSSRTWRVTWSTPPPSLKILRLSVLELWVLTSPISRLGSVTARHSSSGRQPNFAALNRRCQLYSAGRPSRWALATFLVFIVGLLVYLYITDSVLS